MKYKPKVATVEKLSEVLIKNFLHAYSRLDHHH